MRTLLLASLFVGKRGRRAAVGARRRAVRRRPATGLPRDDPGRRRRGPGRRHDPGRPRHVRRGITIDKDVALVGAAAGATTIQGGGPVVTIGAHLAPDPRPSRSPGSRSPAASVESVSRRARTSRESAVESYVPPSAGFATGATVVLDDVTVTGNQAQPVTALPFPCTPTVVCQFGYAEAGGIGNFGTMTLRDSRVTDNEAGAGVTSFAAGAGLYNHVQGALTIERTLISENRLRLARPNAIVASGGGITTHGRLSLSDSIVSDNGVEVEAELPDDVGTASFSGGIEVTNVADATIVRTIVRGNSVRMTNVGGSVLAGVGGISTDENVSLVLRDSTVAHNRVHASTYLPGAGVTAFAGGIELWEGAVEVSRSRIIGNEVRAEGPAGFTGAGGGGIEAEGREPVLVSDSVIAGNSVSAVTAGGFALAVGGGVANGGLLEAAANGRERQHRVGHRPGGLSERRRDPELAHPAPGRTTGGRARPGRQRRHGQPARGQPGEPTFRAAASSPPRRSR